MTPNELFGERYYTTSNYNNYLERKFIEQVNDLIVLFDLKHTDRILDFGCACGGLLKALSEKGYNNSIGTDISLWAIENGKKQYNLNLQHYNRNLLIDAWDIVILLDVLEHMPNEELDKILFLLSSTKVSKGIIVRIPISRDEGEDFVLDCSRQDKTHIQCHSFEWWENRFKNANFIVTPIITKTMYNSEGVLVTILKRSVK